MEKWSNYEISSLRVYIYNCVKAEILAAIWKSDDLVLRTILLDSSGNLLQSSFSKSAGSEPDLNQSLKLVTESPTAVPKNKFFLH